MQVSCNFLSTVRLGYINPQAVGHLLVYDVELLSAMQTEHIDAIIFFGREPSKLTRELENNGTTEFIRTFSYEKHQNKISRGLSYFKSLLRITAHIHRQNISHLHVQWTRVVFLDYLFSQFWRLILGVRVIYTAHNVWPHGREERKSFWLGRYLTSVNGIVVHTAQTAAKLCAFYDLCHTSVSVIPPGPFDLSKLCSGEQPPNDFISEFVTSSDCVFLFLGRPERYKGADLALAGWTLFNKRYPSLSGDCKLIVAGQITEDFKRSYAQHFETKNLILIDRYLSDAEVDLLLARSDCNVLLHREVSVSALFLASLAYGSRMIISETADFYTEVKGSLLVTGAGGSYSSIATGYADIARRRIQSGRPEPEDIQLMQSIYDWRLAADLTYGCYRRASATLETDGAV